MYKAAANTSAVASTGSFNAQNTKFLYNQTSASWSGSAILCWGPLNITNCEFGFNTAGGGAVKPRSSGATTNISGSNFHDNQSVSTAGGGYGGAMQVFDGPTVTINNSSFSKNNAVHGGAIYVSTNSILNVNDSTFSGNSGAHSGGAIRVRAGTESCSTPSKDTSYHRIRIRRIATDHVKRVLLLSKYLISPSALQQRLPPGLIVDVPLNRLTEARFEIVARFPAQLTLTEGGIDSVTTVVPQSIGHKRD
jgi:predicted outer membrane repeat protein